MLTRNVIFLLSGRVIDFDSYLPIGMELKLLRPDWDIHFVTFSPENFKFILRNPTLMSGLEKCGELHFMGATGKGLDRWIGRFGALFGLLCLIATRSGSVLLHGRHYSEGVYRLLYLVNRLRGGQSYILPRSRLVDQGMHNVFRERFQARRESAWPFARLLNGWADGLLYYHDQQPIYLQGMLAYGPMRYLPRLRLGLPNLTSAWQSHIAEEVARTRNEMAAEGLDSDNIYTVIATKTFASTQLRAGDSVVVTFEQILRALRRLCPASTILVRPHPLAVDEPYLHETLTRLDDAKISVTFLHPELLEALSKRVIINAPTNLIYTSLDGRFIDCTDYREEDLAKHGNESFGAGYGTVYVNPNEQHFDKRLALALDDSDVQPAASNIEKRRSLIANNPASVEALLTWLN